MSRYLAIDVDAQGLFVAAGNAQRGKTTVDKVAFAPTTEGSGLSPGTAQALGRQLKDLLKQAGLAAAPALLCLGRDKIILKDVTHPPAPGPDEPVIVRFQAVKDLPNDPEEMDLDYLPTGQTADGQKTALAVFARKDAVKAARAFCEAAGLKLAGLTPRPFAAAAAAQAAVAAGHTEPTDDATDPVAVLTLTESGGEFTAAKAGRVLFTRAVPGPAVQSEAMLVGEVRRNLAVFAAAGGGDPARAVYVAEAGPPEAGWTFRLAAGLPVPVYRFDPLAGTAIGEDVPADARGRFAGAVGMLALVAAGPTLPINFASPRQPKAETNRSKVRLAFAAAVAAALLVAGGAYAYFSLDAKDDEIAKLQKDSKDLDAELKAGEEDQNRLKAAEEFLHHGVAVHDELYELSYEWPNLDRMKLTQVEYVSNKLPTEKDRERIEKERKALPAAKRKELEANPGPTGTLKLTVTTADANQVNQIVNSLVKDGEKSGPNTGYYRYTARTASAAGGGGGGVTGPGGRGNNQAQFVITTNVVPRKPTEYRHKLNVTAPVAQGAGPPVDNADAGGPLGGPADPDDSDREEPSHE